MKTLGFGIAAFTLLSPLGADAAIQLTYRRVASDPPSQGTQVITIEGPRLRFDSTAASRKGTVIIDLTTKRVLVLDHASRTYREMTDVELRGRTAHAQRVREHMQESAGKLPPESRKIAEQMLRKRFGPEVDPSPPAPPVTYEALGGSKKVGTRSCKLYRVRAGERELNESCLAPWQSDRTTKAALQALKAFSDQLRKRLGAWPAFAEQDWSRAPGLPLEQVRYDSTRKVEWSSVLTALARVAAPASTFQPPEDFTRDGPKRTRPYGPGSVHGAPMSPAGPQGPSASPH